jgi:Flavin-binding monooxygenase-like
MAAQGGVIAVTPSIGHLACIIRAVACAWAKPRSIFGLPKPNHRFLEAHPTVSGELTLRLGSGDVVAKPNVARLAGDRVEFADGSVEQAEIVIYATGYKVSFPFFDADFICAPGNVLPLYKRVFKPGIDDLAFVGLAQALPSQFTFVETQSKWLARWLTGRWALPPVQEMKAQIVADDRRLVGHFTPSPRHTMQHDTVIYEHDLRRHVLPAGEARVRAGSAAHGLTLAGRAGRHQPAV